MAQLNLYAPDELVAKIRKLANQSHKSVSEFVVDVIREKIEPPAWSLAFVDVLKIPAESEIPEVKDLPPQTRTGFED